MKSGTKGVMITLGAVGMTALLAGAVMNPADERVAWEDLPQAVRDTILREAGGATIKEIEKEMRGGQVVFEAEWMVNGHEVEIAVAADGSLLAGDDDDDGDDDDGDDGEEEPIPGDQVPEAARRALQKQAGDAQILSYGREVEDGIVIYEAEWRARGMTHEAAVTADGALIEVEETIPANAAPAAVRDAIAKHFGHGAVVVVEKKMVVVYEVEGTVNGRNREIVIFPTGRAHDHHGDDDDDGDGDDDD